MNDVIKPSDGFDYYIGDVYWNNFDLVIGELGRRITGQFHGNWRTYVKDKYKVSGRGLFVHCGNGWVEREFFSDSVISSVVGTDISPDLLSQARQEADAIGLPCDYHILDSNTQDFHDFEYDVVVNHAAFHHIAYIDRAIRSIARGLPENGLLICYDYTGPQRNQYPFEDWSEMVEFNSTLPEKYQADLRYPHLETMLATDPTEAIHSHRILETCSRYFDLVEVVPLGGTIAYEILFNNRALHKDQDSEEGRAVIKSILDKDREYVSLDPKKSYFNFFVGRVKSNAFEDLEQLHMWTHEEDVREAEARKHRGRYAPPRALELIYDQMYALKDG